jgi:hypothetical protein
MCPMFPIEFNFDQQINPWLILHNRFPKPIRVIQDLRSGKMIGKGIEREGLFYLNQAKKTTRNPYSDF